MIKKKEILMISIFFLLLSILALNVNAEQIEIDDFEDGDITDGTPFTYSVDQGTWNATRDEQSKSGIYALKSGPSGVQKIFITDMWDDSEEKLIFGLWIYFPSTADADTYIKIYDGAAQTNAQIGTTVTDGTSIDYYDGSSWIDTTLNYEVGWQHFKLTYNNDTNDFREFCLDGDCVAIDTEESTSITGLVLQDSKNGVYFDDIQINDTNVTGGPPITCSFTIDSSLINNTINFNERELNFTYNASFTNCDTDLMNVSFYLNDVFNVTLSNVNGSLNNWFNYTFNSNYEDYFNVSFNATTGDTESNLYRYFYNVDLVPPDISITTSFVNNTEFYLSQQLHLIVNISDPNLFAYNITFFDNNGNIWNNENYFATNLTNNEYENDTIRSLTELGNYSIFIEAWDSHTNNKVKPIYSSYGENYLNVEGINFQGEIKSELTEFILSEDETKYRFKITWKEDDLTHEINLSSNKFLHYIKNSEYSGHFVYNYERWVDFESDNIKNLTVKELENNKYNIVFNLYEVSDEIEFESIGDLNYKNQKYFYTVVSEEVIELKKINQNLINQNKVIKVNGLIFLFAVFFVIYMFAENELILIFNAVVNAVLVYQFHITNEDIMVYLAILMVILTIVKAIRPADDKDGISATI